MLKQALDVAVVGDTAPIPLADRSDFKRLAEGTLHERVEAAAQIMIAIRLRTAQLRRVLDHAASGDAQLTLLLANTNVSERESVRQGAVAIARREVSDRDVDTLFALLSTEVFLLLTETRKWDLPAYHTWAVGIIRTVLHPEGAT